jgi:uncharacterized protein YdbL (DUF1318 family)
MIRAFLLLAALALGSAALAQTPVIDAARAAGSVGERYDGYLGIASPVSSAVRSQVATVNIRRRALYSDLASRRGVSPQEVGITAGCHLLARVAVGQAYLLANEGWRRRSAGQPAPVPDYCR